MKQDISRAAYYIYNYPIHNGCSIDVSCHRHCHHHHHHHRCYLQGLIYQYLGGSKREGYYHAERNREEGTLYRLKDEFDSTSWGFLKLGTVNIQGHIILYSRWLPYTFWTLSMAYTDKTNKSPSCDKQKCLFSSVTQSCLTLCDPMNYIMPGLPAHHQLQEFTQTHVHRVGDAIRPSHPLFSPSPPAPQSLPASGSFPVSQLLAWGGELEFQL